MLIIKIITLLIIIFIINYVINAKKEIIRDKKQNIIKINNAKRILEHKDILDIIYNIEGYYYYNQQAFIELINHLEKFFEIYDIIKIDNKLSMTLYDNLVDLKYLILNTIISFEIKLPYQINLNDVVNDMQNVLNKYLYEIYELHEKYIKNNGMDHNVKLILPKHPEGYNMDYNLLEPNKKLLFNRL
jgi:hypothetical protein